MRPNLLRLFACPRDHAPLQALGDSFVCSDGHRYPVVDGGLLLIHDDVTHTHWAAEWMLEASRHVRCCSYGTVGWRQGRAALE